MFVPFVPPWRPGPQECKEDATKSGNVTGANITFEITSPRMRWPCLSDDGKAVPYHGHVYVYVHVHGHMNENSNVDLHLDVDG